VSTTSPRRKLQDGRLVRRLAAALRTGATRSEAIRGLGISESTFYRELRRSPELRSLLATPKPPAATAARRRGAAVTHGASSDPSAGSAAAVRGAPEVRGAASADNNRATAASAADQAAQATGRRSRPPAGRRADAAAAKAAATTVKPVAPASKGQAGAAAAKAAPTTPVAPVAAPRKARTAGEAATATRARRRGMKVGDAPPVPSQSEDAPVLISTPAAGTDYVPGTQSASAAAERAPTGNGAAAPVTSWSGLTGLLRAPLGERAAAHDGERVEPAPAASAGRRPMSAPSGADWMPPMAVLVLELGVAIAVGAHPAVILLVAVTTLAVLLAVRRARRIAPRIGHVGVIRFSERLLVPEALPKGAEAAPHAQTGAMPGANGPSESPHTDLRWVAASILKAPSTPDDPRPPHGRG
jgi:hypothetical protein